MERIIEPEILDGLPPADERAVHSRSDLRRVNRLMGHGAIMARLWRSLDIPPGPCSLAEIGAGDGTFCLSLSRRLPPRWSLRSVTLLDRQAVVSPGTVDAFSASGCRAEAVAGDVFDWLVSGPRVTVMIANLFLHHFDEAELGRLLRMASKRTDYFIACEPRRGFLSWMGSRFLGLAGCNQVTRHDAAVSVRAGFAGCELSRLWPAPGWLMAESHRGLFTHAFSARPMAGRAREGTAR